MDLQEIHLYPEPLDPQDAPRSGIQPPPISPVSSVLGMEGLVTRDLVSVALPVEWELCLPRGHHQQACDSVTVAVRAPGCDELDS